MCGYSTTSCPTRDVMPAADTTACTVVSPARPPTGGAIVNDVVTCSSARSNFTGADVGVTVQPAGASIEAVAFIGPFTLFVIVTTTVLVRALLGARGAAAL